MRSTKIASPYRTAYKEGGQEFDHPIGHLRFYGVVEKPFLAGTLLSPQAIEDHRNSYALGQQGEASWRGQDWQKIDLKPAPAIPTGLVLALTGTMRLTNRRTIHVIADDGSNHVYSGAINFSIREGDPELSRAHWVPAYGEGEDAVAESYNLSLNTNRAQLEFLFTAFANGKARLGVMLDVVGFQFGPEASFATFHQPQSYYVETTAVISQFRLTTYPVEEVESPEVAEVEPALPPTPPPPPIDYRASLKKIADNVGWLILVSVCILAAVMFNGHH